MTPAALLLERVEALAGLGSTLHFLTDAISHPGKVLLAIWRPLWSCVIAIGAEEYDGLKVAEIFGFAYVPPSAIERATKVKP